MSPFIAARISTIALMHGLSTQSRAMLQQVTEYRFFTYGIPLGDALELANIDAPVFLVIERAQQWRHDND